MNAMEIIDQMRGLLHRRADLQRDIARARARATSPGRPLDGMPRSKAPEAKLEALGIELADCGVQLQEVEKELARQRRRLEAAISRLEDDKERQMLRLRYIAWMPVSDIALHMHYAREYTYQKLRKAEEKLS